MISEIRTDRTRGHRYQRKIDVRKKVIANKSVTGFEELQSYHDDFARLIKSHSKKLEETRMCLFIAISLRGQYRVFTIHLVQKVAF